MASTADEVFARLYALPQWEASSFSPLEVPRVIAEELDNPQDSFRSVHVAGTNGKGSVCAYLASAFDAAGFRVGQFVSPHLSHVSQRCLLSGVAAENDRFAQAVEQVLDAARRLELTPSFFVVTMLASFLVMREAKVEWGVIEVGLGGTLDATNILRAPSLSVITRIGLDHMHWLGDSLAEIAENKAGIIREQTPVVVAANGEEAVEVITHKAEASRSRMILAQRDFSIQNKSLLYAGESYELGLSEIESQSFHAQNRAAAMVAALESGCLREHLAVAARQVCWPGRTEHMQVERGGLKRAVLLDGLHNPEGAEAFFSYLRRVLEVTPVNSINCVVSIRASKNVGEVAAIISRHVESLTCEVSFYCTGADLSLAAKPEELAAQLPNARVLQYSADALNTALDNTGPQDLLLVVGSLYLVGKLRPMLSAEPYRTINRSA